MTLIKATELLEDTVINHYIKLGWGVNGQELDNLFTFDGVEYKCFTIEDNDVETVWYYADTTVRYKLPPKGEGQMKFLFLLGLL
jgi:hypothetical protein